MQTALGLMERKKTSRILELYFAFGTLKCNWLKHWWQIVWHHKVTYLCIVRQIIVILLDL